MVYKIEKSVTQSGMNIQNVLDLGQLGHKLQKPDVPFRKLFASEYEFFAQRNFRRISIRHLFGLKNTF